MCNGHKIDCDSNRPHTVDVGDPTYNPGLYNCSCSPDLSDSSAGAPPPPPPIDPNDPIAKPEYDDSSWILVDTPHDMGIVGKHSPSENPTQVSRFCTQ
eukprot:SAG31_NODE_25237_length_465_cov_1.125683_1_plen_97_part_01